MNHLKPNLLFPHKNALLSPSFPSPPKKKRMKPQVISVGVNPQRPNTVIRPPCYASHKLDPLAKLLLTPSFPIKLHSSLLLSPPPPPPPPPQKKRMKTQVISMGVSSVKWSDPGHFLKAQGKFIFSFSCTLFLHICDASKLQIEPLKNPLSRSILHYT